MATKFKSKLRRPEYIILIIYMPLYLTFYVAALLTHEFEEMTPEKTGLLVLFFSFMAIITLTFFLELLAGILFIVWAAGVIYVDLTLVTEEQGLGVISAVPIIAVGLLLIQHTIQKKKRLKTAGAEASGR